MNREWLFRHTALPGRALGVALAVIVGGFVASALRADEPLYLHERFDRITLDEKNNNAELMVRPLDFPGRKQPEKPEPTAKLSLQLLDQPDKTYEIEWQHVTKVELFEAMVLEKAKALVKEGNFHEAYDYFKFLRSNYPRLEGLGAAYDAYLMAEANAALSAKQYATALAVFREIHAQNPKAADLEKHLADTTEKLINQYYAAEDFAAARQLVRSLAATHAQSQVVTKWEANLKQKAAELLKQGQQSLATSDLRKADDVARRLTLLWPDLPGAKELAKSVHEKYPRIVVGVTLPAATADPHRLDDWAARRAGRLVWRAIAERTGNGPQGGVYEQPLGEIKVEGNGKKFSIAVKPDLKWSAGQATLSSFDVARRLLALGDSRDPSYTPLWRHLGGTVVPATPTTVEATLEWPCLRPEGLLQLAVPPYADPLLASQPNIGNGPFMLHSATGDDRIFLANPQYPAMGEGSSKEIVEHHFKEKGKAFAALRQGRIQVIDRINPWEVGAVRAVKDLRVESYTGALVHCVVPSARSLMAGNPTFRRALVYGINRAGLLSQLTGNQELPATKVISGPMPSGSEAEVLGSYGYDEGIAPRPYDPRLAMVLVKESLVQTEQTLARLGLDAKALLAQPLVLAHPDEPIARTACVGIRRQLQLIGVNVVLKELSPGAKPEAGEADLLYCALALWEPAVDLPRLLGQEGYSGECSPHMSQALRLLAQSADWGQVRTRLKQIHRLAYEETSVIPLWQLTEHLAYHESVQGIGAHPVSLYQHVEQWRPAFHYPGE